MSSSRRQLGFKSGTHQRTAIDIQDRLVAYKAAKPLDIAYYTRVVREAPARAIDMLLFKDMCREEDGMHLLEHVMPDLTRIYSVLDETARARVDDRVRKSGPYQKAKVFATEVFREVGRIMRRRSQGLTGRDGA